MSFKRFLAGLILIAAFTQCSVQNQLNHQFKGKSKADLVQANGNPFRIENDDKGRTVYVYLKRKFLKAAPINTGQFQYDRFESPRATKRETYKYYINASDIVEEATYDLSYER